MLFLAVCLVGLVLHAAGSVAAGPAGDQSPREIEVLSDVVYGRGGDVSLKLDVYRPKITPEDPMPVLVYIHGGGWWQGDKVNRQVDAMRHFAEQGYFCASVNYRLSGQAAFPAPIHDCKCAIRYLRAHARQYHLDPDHFGVWGDSAGGHLSALVGTSGDVKPLEGTGGWADQSSRVQAVCVRSGPTDMVRHGRYQLRIEKDTAERLIGGPIEQNLEKARFASPMTYVSPDDPPFLILQGATDRLVNADEQARPFQEALEQAGVQSALSVFADTGHGGKAIKECPDLEKFFERHLKARPE